MKVKDLIKDLVKQDPEAEVIMSSDSEGNCYSPLADSWGGGVIYIPESDCVYGEVHDKDEYMKELKEDECDPDPSIQDAVVLYPKQ